MSKITPIKKLDPISVNINEQDVTVEQYLPIQDKLAMIERILNFTIDNTGFLNPVRLEVFTVLEIIATYTNINITEKMMENAPKTYDSLMLNGVIDKIIEAIPEDEYNAVFDAVEECAEHTVAYLNSFVGMMKTINEDYSMSQMNIEEMMKNLEPEKIGLVKEILEKIG